ncbi:MAG: hypothetical protein IAF38_21090 [Bacteroidia bacterium]|nr:hypothetical protein [Bacteroidia bacterium]
MLKLIVGFCIDCNPDSKARPLIAKRCEKHYWIYRATTKKNKLSNATPTTLPIGNALPINECFCRSLRAWYFQHISSSTWICDNCNDPISPSSERANFSVQAHILPKEFFPSIKLLLANHLTLGTHCGCHQRYDLSWESAEKMPVFEQAKLKILSFLHLLNKEEIKRIPNLITVTGTTVSVTVIPELAQKQGLLSQDAAETPVSVTESTG